ncbi:hypothetical protein UVI_02058910 [Ustilaginoidea virens]|uniref:Transcription factor hoxa13 n=1 Tax=Ustilaginoidea virens TaxID=1159556 RepID=A0A1B5L5S9_USTVR|nr:hypothetical protein UVI_02058910 [Ustilaginoidea virens]
MAVADTKGKAGTGPAHANGKLLNGQTKSRRAAPKQRRGFFAWALNCIARLTTWAAILTILFRCPPSFEACGDDSPLICKPYFRVKNVVAPHVQPLFDEYAAPYAQVVRPYCDTLNNRILTPTRRYAVLYTTPLVNRGQAYARAQWVRNGQPRLLRLQTQIKANYDKSVAPYLDKAGEVVGPYYNLAQKHSVQVYSAYLLPGYELARPYAVRGYDAAAEFATSTALPATYWAGAKANAFLDTAVWPQLRFVYVENVEPQLVRIGERLGRYRTKSNVTSKVATTSDRTFGAYSPSTLASSTGAEKQEATSTPTAENKPAEYWNPVKAPPATENESDKRKNAREMVANDLATWQDKFAAQAEEGAGAMEDQVHDIARAIMDENANMNGKALLKELNDTIASEMAKLKESIQSIVKNAGSEAQQECVDAIRTAGVAIKKKAQVIRGWREDYDSELQDTVLNAADVYFQILDETRNLALQNIGMKWAWTDGVTYKDWQKYHELKKTLSSWTEELKQLIVTHPALLEAQELSHQIEENGMSLASAAAKELARLKQVSSWKIKAHDATENFDSDAMRSAADAAERVRAEAILAAEEEKLKDAVAEGAERDAKPNIEPIVEPGIGEEIASEAAADETAIVLEPLTVKDDVLDNTPIIIAEPTVHKADAEPEESPIILGNAPSEPRVASQPKPNTPENEAAASDFEESGAGEAQEQLRSVTPAIFGAAAQSVADRSPILDDDGDSDTLADMARAAQAAYSDAVALAADQYSSALSVVSAQIQGTSKPVHEQLFSSVSAAYGSAVSAASQKLNDAVAGGSTPTPSPTRPSKLPDWQRVESIAAQRLREGRLWAEIQYQSVLIALGAATATPTSAPEKYYEQAKYHYYAGLGLAQDRYSSFMAAASSAWSSATASPTPTDFAGSASSMASVAGKSAAAAVSAADEAVKSAYSAATEGALSMAQDAQDAIEKVADAAAEQMVGMAGSLVDTWDAVVSQISADVYGQPSALGWYEGATQTAGSVAAAVTGAVADSASAASDSAARQFDAVNRIISELMVGKEPTFSESVMSRLSAAYATATSNVGSVASEASVAAASARNKLSSVASQATGAVKDSAQKLRDEL